MLDAVKRTEQCGGNVREIPTVCDQDWADEMNRNALWEFMGLWKGMADKLDGTYSRRRPKEAAMKILAEKTLAMAADLFSGDEPIVSGSFVQSCKASYLDPLLLLLLPSAFFTPVS